MHARIFFENYFLKIIEDFYFVFTESDLDIRKD